MDGAPATHIRQFLPHTATLLLLGAAAVGSISGEPWGKTASAVGWLGFGVLLLATSAGAAVRNRGTRRLGWLAFAGAGAISLVGLAGWLSGQSGDYPGFADYIFLSTIPCVVAGMLAMYPRWQAGLYRVIAALDTGILACAGAIILTLTLYDPVATSSRSTAYIVTALATPVLWTAAALSGLRLVWLLAGRGLRRAELLLAVAVTVHAVCATIYAAQLLQGGYDLGGALDAGYHVSSAL
ncbi:MAG: hypothetical protein IT463_14765, partial [Planctomycetes bacterium]|nr:hypothetical protein [Planctomycetota bacterium]